MNTTLKACIIELDKEQPTRVRRVNIVSAFDNVSTLYVGNVDSIPNSYLDCKWCELYKRPKSDLLEISIHCLPSYV